MRTTTYPLGVGCGQGSRAAADGPCLVVTCGPSVAGSMLEREVMAGSRPQRPCHDPDTQATHSQPSPAPTALRRDRDRLGWGADRAVDLARRPGGNDGGVPARHHDPPPVLRRAAGRAQPAGGCRWWASPTRVTARAPASSLGWAGPTWCSMPPTPSTGPPTIGGAPALVAAPPQRRDHKQRGATTTSRMLLPILRGFTGDSTKAPIRWSSSSRVGPVPSCHSCPPSCCLRPLCRGCRHAPGFG
jgi:hypothetical protein